MIKYFTNRKKNQIIIKGYCDHFNKLKFCDISKYKGQSKIISYQRLKKVRQNEVVSNQIFRYFNQCFLLQKMMERQFQLHTIKSNCKRMSMFVHQLEINYLVSKMMYLDVLYNNLINNRYRWTSILYKNNAFQSAVLIIKRNILIIHSQQKKDKQNKLQSQFSDLKQQEYICGIIGEQKEIETITMGNLCSESRSISKIEYQKPSVQYEQALNKTSFTIMQGSFLFSQANILVNAHQAPFTLSPIIKHAKLSTDVTSKQNQAQVGTIVHTENSGQLKYQHIIHVYLPFWPSCEDVTEVQGKLYETYKKVLEKADELKQESITFTDLTLPPMQIPISLHAECLIGAVILYIEENQNRTSIRNVTFINQERNKIQRYTYQLQSKLVGMNETTVKDKIRKSISEICGYNSLQFQKVQLVDDNYKSLQGSQATKNQCETEGSTVNHSKQQLGLIAELDLEKEEFETELNKLKKVQSQDNRVAQSDEENLMDSQHYKQQ